MQRSQVAEEQRADLYQRLADAAAAVPGVERAAASLLTPVSGQGWNNAFDIPGKPNLSFRERLAFLNAITPGWHSVYGTRLVAGREFTDADRKGAPPVAIVNEAYVKKFLRPGSALGHSAARRAGQVSSRRRWRSSASSRTPRTGPCATRCRRPSTCRWRSPRRVSQRRRRRARAAARRRCWFAG